VDDHFNVEIRGDDRTTVLTLSGELDLASSSELEEALERVTGWGTHVVVLDMTELEFMDSTGLQVLVKAQLRADEGGPRLEVITGSRQVRRLLRVTGADRCLTMMDAPQNR